MTIFACKPLKKITVAARWQHWNTVTQVRVIQPVISIQCLGVARLQTQPHSFNEAAVVCVGQALQRAVTLCCGVNGKFQFGGRWCMMQRYVARARILSSELVISNCWRSENFSTGPNDRQRLPRWDGRVVVAGHPRYPLKLICPPPCLTSPHHALPKPLRNTGNYTQRVRVMQFLVKTESSVLLLARELVLL